MPEVRDELSQEYNQTKSKINNESTVLVKDCEDAIEVPEMQIKQRKVSTKTTNRDYLEKANNIENSILITK